jgi:hypothetical protein
MHGVPHVDRRIASAADESHDSIYKQPLIFKKAWQRNNDLDSSQD